MPPKTIKMALVDMMENLSSQNFERFCHSLLDRREEPQVRRNRVEGRTRLEVVDVLVSTFTEPKAVQVSVEILREISLNDEAQRLDYPEDLSFLLDSKAPVQQQQQQQQYVAESSYPEPPKASHPYDTKGFENKLDRSPSLNVDQTHLEWQTFDGSLPKGAVSIYNKYVGRIDYVSKYKSVAGFYNPAMGPYCHYPFATKEHLGSPFEILVNKGDFELLEWKDGSYGSVPPNSVKTISNKDIYVGKNKYGLGKMRVRHKNFFLPWKGSEHWYNDYQVLTFSKDIYSEDISDVKYKTDGAKIVKHLPETMTKATLINNGCQTATQTATLSKKSQVEQRWDSSFSFTLGVNSSITTQIPSIASIGIEYSASTTLQFTKGATYTESKDYTVSVECNVPPKHSCSVTMVGYKYEADISYTARLKRTYNNGEIRWTSISGTYKGVQVMEVESVVGRCEPLSA